MKKLLIIFVLINVITNLYSQSTLLWSQDFTTNLNNYFSEYPEIQTNSNTITVIGRKNTDNGQRLSIVKYSLDGAIITSTTFGNDFTTNNTLIDYKFDSSNHLYLLQKEMLGYYKSKIVIQKYSLDGNLIWIKQIQDDTDISYTPRSIGLASDNFFFITGHKESNYPIEGDDTISTITIPFLFAYDNEGNQIWQREFNINTEINYFFTNLFIYNNTAFLFGYNASYNYNLIKVDSNNNLTINTNTGILNGVSDMKLTPDNNLLLTSGAKYRISKADLNGTVLWTKYYGTYLPSNVSGDTINSTILDENGNIYITGRHYGHNFGTASYTNCDILTIKYDSNGNIIWQNRYQYGINNCDQGNFIELKNGQIYIGGESERFGMGSNYDYVLLKINSLTGISTGIYRYNGVENGNDSISSLSVLDNNNVALTGLSYMNSNYNWTTQLLSDVNLSNDYFNNENNITISPNPIANGDILTIKGKEFRSYSITSTIGQIIQEGKFEQDVIQKIKINNFSKGMYLLQLKSEENKTITKKIIIE